MARRIGTPPPAQKEQNDDPTTGRNFARLTTAIVDSIYGGSLQADLKVEKIIFSREPLIDRTETEVRAQIKNIGPINARNVKIRFFDGSELIDEKTIPVIRAMDPDGVWVTARYNATMTNTGGISEQHRIIVNVNPLHAVQETKYSDNVAQRQLDVVEQASSSPSFAPPMSLVVMAVLAVAVAGELLRKRQED